MKSSFTALCFTMLTPAFWSFAQEPGIMLHEESLITESVSFRLPDSIESERYTEQDWVMLSPSHEVRRESRTININGSEEYSILIQESSQAKDWELVPLHIVSDADGMSLFDKDGQLLELYPHSSYYLSLQDSLELLRRDHGIPVMTHLPYLEDMDQEALQNAGVVVTGDRNHYQIKSASGELEVNHHHNYLIQRRFDKEFGIPFYEYTSYETTAQGFLIPRMRKVHQLERTYSGFCVEQVSTWEQSESVYYVSPEYAITNKSEGITGPFQVFPNPVIDELSIKASPGATNSSYEVFLYDSMYDLVLHKQGLSGRSEMKLDLSGLPPGYYHLRIQHARENYSFKIFKQ